MSGAPRGAATLAQYGHRREPHPALASGSGAGDPRVNIQNDKGMAKAYQVRQVLKAIERLEAQRGTQA